MAGYITGQVISAEEGLRGKDWKWS